MKKTVLIGVASGIAAYKVLDLIKELKNEGLDVVVIMTQSATKMVSPSEFEKASGNKVYIDLFEKYFDYKEVLKKKKVEHIDVADKADLMVILPATANVIGKLAYGLADDFLTTTALAVTSTILVCPSMNVNMWNNRQVKQNVSILKENGYQIVEPAEGMLACGYEGKGRLEDVQIIKDEIMVHLKRTDSLKDKRIIITAGGTIEKIDDVRFISNRSSGKMGIAIAEECYLGGADILLLRAKSSVKPRYIIPEKTFETAQDLFHLIKKEVGRSDIIFHTAAVGDFEVDGNIKGKISSKESLTIKLKPALKIINQIKKLNPNIKLIAFKAEYGLTDPEMIKKAQEKINESDADFVIVNDISKADRGFEADTNEVIVVLKNGESAKIPLDSKREIAKGIVELAT